MLNNCHNVIIDLKTNITMLHSYLPKLILTSLFIPVCSLMTKLRSANRGSLSGTDESTMLRVSNLELMTCKQLFVACEGDRPEGTEVLLTQRDRTNASNVGIYKFEQFLKHRDHRPVPSTEQTFKKVKFLVTSG